MKHHYHYDMGIMLEYFEECQWIKQLIRP